MSFKSEKEMTNYIDIFFNKTFKDQNDKIEYYKEFRGLAGRPDYLIIQKETKLQNINYIITVELKLRNWQRALEQAYRYSTYSNESFVIMDSDFVHNAVNNLNQFKKFNIGLASFDLDENFTIHYYPEPSRPFSKYYLRKMTKKFKNNYNLNLTYNEINKPEISNYLKKYTI